MMLGSKLVCAAAVSSLLAIASCSRGVFSSPLYLAVTVSPRPVSVPVGGTVTFSGSVTNNLSVPTWTILDGSSTPDPGTLKAVAGQPNSVVFTAPAAPPIYTGTPAAFVQGTVTVQATVVPPPGSSSLPDAHDSVTVFITAPAVSVGISPAAVTVPLGQTQYFAAYAVGNTNNVLTYQVNGVTGGSTTFGSISTAGIYTAPGALPPTGNTVTVTVISQADPTKTATATITLM